MTDHLLAMERLIRQYRTVGRDAAGGIRRSGWSGAEANRSPIWRWSHRLLTTFIGSQVIEGRHTGGLRQSRKPDVDALGTSLGDIRAALAGVLARTDQILAGSVSSFRGDAEVLVHRLAFVMLAALPLSLVVVLVFRGMFHRLAVQFEGAIDSLGSGQRDREIHLDGPLDMKFVGRRLEWLRRRLIELESQRNQFLRNASHELKTPLAAIREGLSC
jgi:signal transduction histidine kinase